MVSPGPTYQTQEMSHADTGLPGIWNYRLGSGSHGPVNILVAQDFAGFDLGAYTCILLYPRVSEQLPQIFMYLCCETEKKMKSIPQCSIKEFINGLTAGIDYPASGKRKIY